MPIALEKTSEAGSMPEACDFLLTQRRLQMLQLADSALPIGALSHSFGLESLVAEGSLEVAHLPQFFAEWLKGTGHAEAVLCVRGHQVQTVSEWNELNATASAMRPAREGRDASLKLGRRLLSLAAGLEPHERLRMQGDAHLAAVYGLFGSVLELPAGEAVAAFLHQCLFGAVSACQRLLPLGQSAAMQMLWQMKPGMAAVISRACNAPEIGSVWTTQPTLEIASMRHPWLSTRLFIS